MMYRYSTRTSSCTPAKRGSRSSTIRESDWRFVPYSKCRDDAKSRPYIKGVPITTTVLSCPKGQGDLSTEVYRPTFEDPYTVEMRELYACIVDGKPIKTTPEDAINDTKLNLMIMRAVVAGEQR